VQWSLGPKLVAINTINVLLCYTEDIHNFILSFQKLSYNFSPASVISFYSSACVQIVGTTVSTAAVTVWVPDISSSDSQAERVSRMHCSDSLFHRAVWCSSHVKLCSCGPLFGSRVAATVTVTKDLVVFLRHSTKFPAWDLDYVMTSHFRTSSILLPVIPSFDAVRYEKMTMLCSER